MPSGLRSRVPANITSSMRLPRRLFADCSPSTQLMASLMFDFPQPLGPTMAAMPSPLNRSSVRSQKDLNPCSSTRFSLSKASPRQRHGGVATILNPSEAKVKYLGHIWLALLVDGHNIWWTAIRLRVPFDAGNALAPLLLEARPLGFA